MLFFNGRKHQNILGRFVLSSPPGTQRKLFKKTRSDELFHFGWGFSGGLALHPWAHKLMVSMWDPRRRQPDRAKVNYAHKTPQPKVKPQIVLAKAFEGNLRNHPCDLWEFKGLPGVNQDFPEELQSLPSRTYPSGPPPLRTPPPDPIRT